MDAELERVIAEIESRFDSELARQEEEAAEDLAAGLRQDRLLRAELRRRAAGLLIHDGGRSEITIVGRDYLGCGWPLSAVTKIERAVVALQDVGAPPATRDDTFIEVVRRWQRARLRVELTTAGEVPLSGTLDRVAGDHVLIETLAGPVIVALPVIGSVRLVRGG